MGTPDPRFDAFDARLTRWTARHAISIGIDFLIGAAVRGGMLIADPHAANTARSMERDPA